MNMIFCHGCGKQIHESAKSCPSCGARQRTLNEKNKIIAAILALFLGSFGIHQFYLGRIGLGILYLLFFWTFIPGFVGFIEGIILLCMSEQKFDYKFNS